ncbi:MAG: cupredoxin domain-containing protein [Dehalococcoidia bacterium]
MKLDVAKLPLGEALIVFVLVAVVVTFLLAFTLPPDAGIEGVEPVDGEAVAELSPTAEETPTDGGSAGEGTTVEIAMIPVLAFDTADVTVSAGQPVTLTADNTDPGIPHNWAVYTDDSASELIAGTPICTDCTETITFDAPAPGDYFFRCDIHPIQMVGTFTVE